MVTHAAIFDFAREMTAELLEKLPSTSRTRLSTKRYWREVTLSLFELFGAVMIWRGLWVSYDMERASGERHDSSDICDTKSSRPGFLLRTKRSDTLNLGNPRMS